MNIVVDDDLTAMTSGCNQHGIAVVMDRKEAQNGVYDRVHKTNPQHRPRVGIWNGDRKWPAPATPSLNYCTPQSLLYRILIADSADDVQHYQFDEFHDLSHWGILLLSYLLHLLDERIELRIYRITATQDTLLAEAILRAAQERGDLEPLHWGSKATPGKPHQLLIPSLGLQRRMVPKATQAQATGRRSSPIPCCRPTSPT